MTQSSPLSKKGAGGMTVHLSLFWFLFMCGWGIVFPYYSLYLGRELGLSPSQVGIVMTMFPLMGILTQPFWGQLADRTGSRRRVLAIVAAGTGVVGAGLVLMDGFVTAVLGTALVAVFSTSVLSMATAVTLAAVGRAGIGRFGLIRMWGTLGFLAMVIAFPRFLEIDGVAGSGPAGSGPAGSGPAGSGLAWMFPAAGLFIAVSAVCALTVPDSAGLALRASRDDLRRLLRHPPVVRLLAVVFLAHLCMQGSINFFPLYVRERGGGVTTVGNMWILMLLLEIPLIGFAGAALRRLGARGLLRMGLAAEALRWITCALSRDLGLIAVVQTMHGVGVAGVLVGAPLYLEKAAPERLRSTGQALIATVGFGFGAILSNAAFGWLFDHAGVGLPYAAAGFGAAILALLVRRALPEPHVPAM